MVSAADVLSPILEDSRNPETTIPQEWHLIAPASIKDLGGKPVILDLIEELQSFDPHFVDGESASCLFESTKLSSLPITQALRWPVDLFTL
jgi:hypothetical protein